MTISVPRRRRPVGQATANPGEDRFADRGPIAVCWTSFAYPRGIGLDPNVNGTVNEGDRIAASDPRVIRYPFYFVPDGYTDADLARARHELEVRNQRPEKRPDPRSLPKRLQVVCVEPIRDRSLSGRLIIIDVGTIARAGHPMARKYPACWAPVERPEPQPKPSREELERRAQNVREQQTYSGWLPDPLR